MRTVLFTAIVASVPLARAHISFYDPSMWGYNVRAEDYPYDNRPETPLQEYPFNKWWFHNHLAHPPAPNTFFELPAGGVAMSQLACNKGATKWWPDSEGHTDVRQGEYPCPGSPTSAFHTTGEDDLRGCALSIAYTSDVNSIKAEDLAIFSVNHKCVWTVNTPFPVPKDMPPCPEGGCICAWHWIHSKNSGSAQMYMNGFRCKVTGSTSGTSVLKPVVPKRCTGDLSKCNQGAQQPLYWFQAEGNNMFNGQYDPPAYLEEWGFTDGAQNKIFGKRDDGSNTTLPVDKPTSTLSVDKPTSTLPVDKPTSTLPVDKPTSTLPVDKPTSTLPVDKPTSTLPVDKPTSTLPVDKPTSIPTDKPTSIPTDKPTSTPVDKPTSTPVDKPAPPPAESKPPSTPVDNKPTSTEPPKDNHTPANGDGCDDGDSPKPPTSPSTSPALPRPSRKPRCRDRKTKKVREVVSRHFKHMRHNARGHTH